MSLSKLLFGSRESNDFASIGLLFARLFFGFAMILHGTPKLFAPTSWLGDSVPAVIQLLPILAEVGGGLAWIIGLLTPLASVGIAITMTAATFMFHTKIHDPIFRITVGSSNEGAGSTYLGLPNWLALGGGRSLQGSGSSELAVIFAFVAVIFFFTGPGKYSVDHLIKKEL